jgi:hypothetical protein
LPPIFLKERPNETVEKPFAWEIFTKISHNRLKNRQNVLQNLNTGHFNK